MIEGFNLSSMQCLIFKFFLNLCILETLSTTILKDWIFLLDWVFFDLSSISLLFSFKRDLSMSIIDSSLVNSTWCFGRGFGVTTLCIPILLSSSSVCTMLSAFNFWLLLILSLILDTHSACLISL
eukprot:NODE_716_length_4503_cov_0.446639.p3 type:complete len:125 gc:universal NODE_716_length_4503_cov_0.446639:591-217(-)